MIGYGEGMSPAENQKEERRDERKIPVAARGFPGYALGVWNLRNTFDRNHSGKTDVMDPADDLVNVRCMTRT